MLRRPGHSNFFQYPSFSGPTWKLVGHSCSLHFFKRKKSRASKTNKIAHEKFGQRRQNLLRKIMKNCTVPKNKPKTNVKALKIGQNQSILRLNPIKRALHAF